MSDAIVAAAKRLCAARIERRETRKVLLAFRVERGACDAPPDDASACFYSREPIENWCDTCRDSQPIWKAYQTACAKQRAAIRSLMAACAKEPWR